MSEPLPPQVIQLTPPGRGAVATLLVEGDGAAGLLEGVFRAKDGRPLTDFATDRLVFGHFGIGLDSESGPGTAEEVVVRCRSPRSVEVHCHGGHAAVARIVDVLVARGGRTLGWRQWVRRHHDDPIAAEARIALADARTERTAAILLDQVHGALGGAVGRIQNALGLNNVSAAEKELDDLLARAPLGRHLVEPWRVVLAGRPNVGKSSLINALVGYGRAIVHHAPGTTRDVVTAATAIDGWPVELSDTAGLGQGDHPLERAGVERAEAALATADLVVLVFDSARRCSDADRALLESRPSAVVVWNKCDLPPARGGRPPGLAVSALRGDGIAELVRRIADRLAPHPPPPGSAVPFTSDQIADLRSAAVALARDDVAAARCSTAALGCVRANIRPTRS